jgi:hypothetical protein
MRFAAKEYPHRPGIAPALGLHTEGDRHSIVPQTALVKERVMRSSLLRWTKRAPSRRQFLRTAAGAAGGVLGASLWFPARAWARRNVAPKPIPGGTTIVIGDEEFFIHHFPVTGPTEPSEITDLNGHSGDCRVLGSGTGINTDTGETMPLLYQADMGFMKGDYISEDGHRHHGTFAFV